MKFKLFIAFSLAVLVTYQGANSLPTNNEQITIVLVDPEDEIAMQAVQAANALFANPENLNQLIDQLKSSPMPKRRQRIENSVLSRQKKFMELMERFLVTPFDAEDDEAIEAFNTIREKIVTAVMKAPTEVEYYDRLYVIGKYYQDHREEVARFASLRSHLSDAFVDMEMRRIKMNRRISMVAAATGAVATGIFSAKLSGKWLAIKADDGVIKKLGKVSGRAGMVTVGAMMGGAAGYAAGLYITDLLSLRQRQPFDPMDGTEDPGDLLDLIDQID